VVEVSGVSVEVFGVFGVTKVSTAETRSGGKVVGSVGSRREAGDVTAPLRQ
jgi:hypothetical protein